MHFDFDERYQDVEPVGTAISRREGVVLSVVAHVLVVGVLLAAPQFLPVSPPDASPLTQRSHDRDVMRVVLAPAPRQKAPARPPPRALASDVDSVAQSPELSARAENLLPPSTGDSRDPAEALRVAERPALPDVSSESGSALEDTQRPLPVPSSPSASPSTLAAKLARRGVLSDAIAQWQRYAAGPAFHNPDGGATESGSQIQFDSKGVEFGPWIRRFVAQVKRNWMAPNAVMGMRGSVVVQFNVHRDGSLTDVTVVAASPVDSFNRAAVNALLASNPTQPLPPEYPDDRAFFTFTFHYNEPVVP